MTTMARHAIPSLTDLRARIERQQHELEALLRVLGSTATLDHAMGGGRGVVGVTAGGTGVHGLSYRDGNGVEGTSVVGSGVQGMSDSGIGVSGQSTSTGVFGFGGNIGVEGASEHIGVLGGGPLGSIFEEGANIYAGIAGTGPTDPEVAQYSYGGWFDGIAGTAPIHLEPAQNFAPPAAAQRGDLFVDSTGRLWFCTDGGDPATWREIQLT